MATLVEELVDTEEHVSSFSQSVRFRRFVVTSDPDDVGNVITKPYEVEGLPIDYGLPKLGDPHPTNDGSSVVEINPRWLPDSAQPNYQVEVIIRYEFAQAGGGIPPTSVKINMEFGVTNQFMDVDLNGQPLGFSAFYKTIEVVEYKDDDKIEAGTRLKPPGKESGTVKRVGGLVGKWKDSEEIDKNYQNLVRLGDQHAVIGTNILVPTVHISAELPEGTKWDKQRRNTAMGMMTAVHHADGEEGQFLGMRDRSVQLIGVRVTQLGLSWVDNVRIVLNFRAAVLSIPGKGNDMPLKYHPVFLYDLVQDLTEDDPQQPEVIEDSEGGKHPVVNRVVNVNDITNMPFPLRAPIYKDANFRLLFANLP